MTRKESSGIELELDMASVDMEPTKLHNVNLVRLGCKEVAVSHALSKCQMWFGYHFISKLDGSGSESHSTDYSPEV